MAWQEAQWKRSGAVVKIDTSSSEQTFTSSLLESIYNLSYASSSNSSSSTWNASAGGGFEIPFICSFGASGGGGQTFNDVSTSLSETISTCVNTASNYTKQQKSKWNLSSFDSLRTSSVVNINDKSVVTSIDKLSKTKIAVYYYHTIYKEYECVTVLKRVRYMHPIYNTISAVSVVGQGKKNM